MCVAIMANKYYGSENLLLPLSLCRSSPPLALQSVVVREVVPLLANGPVRRVSGLVLVLVVVAVHGQSVAVLVGRHLLGIAQSSVAARLILL